MLLPIIQILRNFTKKMGGYFYQKAIGLYRKAFAFKTVIKKIKRGKFVFYSSSKIELRNKITTIAINKEVGGQKLAIGNCHQIDS